MKYKKHFHLSNAILLSTVLSGCQTVPKNIGISISSTEIGIVYTAKLKKIYPIFVKTDINNSSSEGIAGLAALLAEYAFQSSTYVGALSSISSSLATSATGKYETQYAGLYCHYILEVNGKELENSIKSANGEQINNDEAGFENSTELDDQSFDSEEIDDEELTNLSEKPSDLANDIWNSLTQTLDKLQTVVNIEDKQKKPITSEIFVVNPCRNFKIGSTLTISKGRETVILQSK